MMPNLLEQYAGKILKMKLRTREYFNFKDLHFDKKTTASTQAPRKCDIIATKNCIYLQQKYKNALCRSCNGEVDLGFFIFKRNHDH